MDELVAIEYFVPPYPCSPTFVDAESLFEIAVIEDSAPCRMSETESGITLVIAGISKEIPSISTVLLPDFS